MTDPTGAVVVGAAITITDVARDQAYNVLTNGYGLYSSGGLIPAEYQILVEAPGFQKLVLGTRVQVGVTTAANVQLKPGAEKQVVTVVGSTLQVNGEQPTVQGVLTTQQIEELSLEKRIMRTPRRRSEAAGPSLLDVAMEVKPELTREDFGRRLRNFLEGQRLRKSVDERLVERLYRQSLFFLQRREAVRRMRQLRDSPDWRRKASLEKRLRKEVRRFKDRIERFITGQHPLSDMLVGSLHTRLERRLDDIEWFRMADKSQLSSYVRPELESTYMWEINAILSNRLPQLSKEEIRFLIAGVMYAAEVFTQEEALSEEGQNRVMGRIYRWRISDRREQMKAGWPNADLG